MKSKELSFSFLDDSEELPLVPESCVLIVFSPPSAAGLCIKKGAIPPYCILLVFLLGCGINFTLFPLFLVLESSAILLIFLKWSTESLIVLYSKSYF